MMRAACLCVLALASAAAAQALSCSPWMLASVPLQHFRNVPITLNGTAMTIDATVDLCGSNTQFSSAAFEYNSIEATQQDWTAATVDGAPALTAQLYTDSQGYCPCQTINVVLSCGTTPTLQWVSLNETAVLSPHATYTIDWHLSTSVVCPATPAPAGAAIGVTYYSDYTCQTAVSTLQRQPGCHATPRGNSQLRYWADFGATGGAMVVGDFSGLCSGLPAKSTKYFLQTCYAEVDGTSFQVTAAPTPPTITVANCLDYKCTAPCAPATLSSRCVATPRGGSQLHYCIQNVINSMVVELFRNSTTCGGAADATEVYSMYKCYPRQDVTSFTVTHCGA
jgi:hypothetical protein